MFSATAISIRCPSPPNHVPDAELAQGSIHRRLMWRGKSHLVLQLFMLVATLLTTRCSAETFTLKNGMEVSGSPIRLSSFGTDMFSGTGGGGVDVKPIFMVDDGLRRTYFSTYQKESMRVDIESPEIIKLKQPIARKGPIVGGLGPYFKSPTPFDDFGRRTVFLNTVQGRLECIQGITEITPLYTRAQGLQADRSYVWDTRLATSSIPRETLSRILRSHLSATESNDRLSIVRLYLQSQRYGDAEEELQGAIKDFPDLKDLSNQLRELQQLHAKQRLNEIKIRRAAGQHALALKLLQNFPEKDVAGELLLQVRELSDEYAKSKTDADHAFDLFNAQLDDQPEGARKEKLLEFREELASDLGFDTMDRLVSYLRLSDDPDLTSEQKLSLAVSRWILGTDGTENLAVSLSLFRTRELVRRYLTSELESERQQILVSLRSEEAASPKYVAKMLAAMRPVADVTLLADQESNLAEVGKTENGAVEPVDGEVNGGEDLPPGMYEFFLPGMREGEQLRYVAQVPPEYHSYKRYPAIVTLHGAGSSPERQLDWWVGDYNPQLQMRMGQAARKGYIVIAPAWNMEPRQRKYKYSVPEHATVLASLRDAMRRFSIDSDRVYLSGHSLGGDAAWDIGLAHPDLWAGVLLVGASAVYGDKDAPKYVSQYWENARNLPIMLIIGALDVARVAANQRELNRYLTRKDFDMLVVEYRGRGHEHFQDEIHRMFDWMKFHRRDFFPRDFEASSMRPWDNFFWWFEFEGLPERSIVLPSGDWPKSKRPMKISASAREKQTLSVKAGSDRAMLWLSPELVDLDQRVTVKWNGASRKAHEISPDIAVMLEDVRRRGDRQHPFWAKIQVGKPL